MSIDEEQEYWADLVTGYAETGILLEQPEGKHFSDLGFVIQVEANPKDDSRQSERDEPETSKTPGAPASSVVA